MKKVKFFSNPSRFLAKALLERLSLMQESEHERIILDFIKEIRKNQRRK